MNPWRGLKNLPGDMWILFFTTLINRSGTMVLPFLAIYLVNVRHTSVGQAGLVLAFYGIGSLVTSPVIGRFADRFGKSKIMILSLLFSGLMLFVYPLIKDYNFMLAATLIWAIINEAFRPANLSFISEVVPPEQRRSAFAFNRLAVNLGMSIGPVVGGLLILINFNLIFYVDGITSVIAGIFLLRSSKKFHEERYGAGGKSKAKISSSAFDIFKDKSFLFFILSLLPVQLVFFQLQASLPLFVVRNLGLPASKFGMLIAVNTVIIIFVEVPLNNLIIKWEHRKNLFLGSILCAIGFGGLVFTSNIYDLVIMIVIWTFGEMILFPASTAYVSEISPPDRRGEYMGYYQMLFSFSFSFGPWFGTMIYQFYGASVLWTLTFIFGMISGIMMLNLKHGKQLTLAETEE